MITGIGTHIKVRDFKRSVAFYKALGFKKVFECGPNCPVKEAYSGMIFEHGGCKLEIADGHRAVKKGVFLEQVTSSKISLVIYVSTLGSVIKSCERAGISIAVKPRHFYWNTLELVINDPDGVVLVFVAPYSKQEAKKLKADETYSVQSMIP